MECCLQRGFWAEFAGQGMDRERRLLDLGADAGGAAEVGEVGGEAVADIDAGCREIAPQQRASPMSRRGSGKRWGWSSVVAR